MTIVVAFLCTDGVVVAADSMVSGDMDLPYRSCKKIQILRGNQICAFAGDLGRGARFWSVANRDHTAIDLATDPNQYPRQLSGNILDEFQSTRIMNYKDRATDINFNLEAVLAYGQGDEFRCCVFDKHMQHQLLNEDYFYEVLGSGHLSAEPFLHFLVKDVFCHDHGPVTVPEGELIAIWTIKQVIATNAGGVGGPIQVATLKRRDDQGGVQVATPGRGDDQGAFVVREFLAADKWDHEISIEAALKVLRDWKDSFRAAGQDKPLPPKLKTE